MQKTVLRWVGSSSLVVTAILASACNDAPVAPRSASTKAPRVAAAADVSDGNRLPDLTGCEKLGAPVGSTLLLHGYGIGVQIYHWNGTSWGTATPSATIFADQAGTGKLADHFGGPTWQSTSGSKVVGTVAERCPVDPASIPWLSLTGIADGAGIFADVNFIQRLYTVGGNAPSTPGSVIGQEAQIPYTADYLFYKAP
jgi:hypothetical protein